MSRPVNHILIAGRQASGKSTLAAVLARFFKQTHPNIEVRFVDEGVDTPPPGNEGGVISGPVLIETTLDQRRVYDMAVHFDELEALPDDGAQYHEDAMRTAAGPEVFHVPEDDSILDVSNAFFIDVREFLIAAAKLDDWKSRLFYNKPKYGRADLGDTGWQQDMPDFVDIMEGEMTFDNIGNPQLIHAVLGVASESGELLADLAQLGRGLDDREDVIANMVRETGDIDWFQELLAHGLGFPVSQARHVNIARLRERFPDKFTEADAVARADEQEAARDFVAPPATESHTGASEGQPERLDPAETHGDAS